MLIDCLMKRLIYQRAHIFEKWMKSYDNVQLRNKSTHSLNIQKKMFRDNYCHNIT